MSNIINLFGIQYTVNFDVPSLFHFKNGNYDTEINIYSSEDIKLSEQINLENFIGNNDFNVISIWKQKEGKIVLGRYITSLFMMLKNNNVFINTKSNDYQKNKIASLISMFSLISTNLSINRNTLPLHGCSLLLDNEAIILVGESGSGKSTLSSYLINKKNAKMISDDLSIVEFKKGKYVLNNGFQFLKLWPDDKTFANEFRLTDKIVAHAAKSVVEIEYKHKNINHDVRLNTIYILNRSKSVEDVSYYLIKKEEIFVLLMKYMYMKYVFSKEELLLLSKNIFTSYLNLQICVINVPNNINKLEDVYNVIEKINGGVYDFKKARDE